MQGEGDQGALFIFTVTALFVQLFSCCFLSNSQLIVDTDRDRMSLNARCFLLTVVQQVEQLQLVSEDFALKHYKFI